jgi:Ni,Fe-hydrogenase III large subunit
MNGQGRPRWPPGTTPVPEITLPIGPQHPLIKEPIAIQLDLRGETVTAARVEIGYVHRGLEQLLQRRSYAQGVAVVERVCGICSHAHTTAYCQAVETLLGLEITERAEAIRALLCELERLHSHLLWLGVLAEAIGFTAIFMYAWREREHLLDLMEIISGGRIAHGANVIGGVREDLSPDQAAATENHLSELTKNMRVFSDLVERDRSFHRRTRGIGLLPIEIVSAYGVVGPMARASGATLDIRRAAPYRRLQVPAAVATEGDVWARAWTRVQEMRHSIGLCQDIVRCLPEGSLATRVPRRIPAGAAISRVEAPRGELLYYVQSDGGENPARVHVRTPTLPTLLVMEKMLPGLQTGDIAAVVAGADLCMACADR